MSTTTRKRPANRKAPATRKLPVLPLVVVFVLAAAALVIVAAHWCPHCQAEIPRLVEWMEAGGGTEVDIVVVSTGADETKPNWSPSEWLERERWQGEVLVDDSEASAAAAYGLDGYPFFTFVDAEGRVVWRGAGELGTDVIERGLQMEVPSS